MHPGQVVRQGRQDAGPVLARRAMDQHRTLGRGQGAEIAGEEVKVTGLERRRAVIGEHVTPKRRFAQIRPADMRLPSVLLVAADVIVDDLSDEARVPPRWVPQSLAPAPQINDHR